MFFYVFIDPDIVTEATAENEMGLGRLVEVLRGMDRDCLMVETDYWRVGEELKEKIKEIPFQWEKKQVLELIIHLWARGPLVVMDGDDGEVALIDFALACAAAAGIDLILTPRTDCTATDDCFEASTLANLHRTHFANKRQSIGSGISVREGDMTVDELFEMCFPKLVFHATSIRIIDYALGTYLGETQYQNLPKWVVWLDSHLKNRDDAKLTIMTVAEEGTSNYYCLQEQVKDLNSQVDLEVKLECEDHRSALPHRRYLKVDHIWLDIDSGVDICDLENRCRRVSINYSKRPR